MISDHRTSAERPPLRPIGDFLYEVGAAYRSDMRVPARLFADATLLAQLELDRSLEQLVNVTTLPGIVRAAYGMPDMHEGYGFPVGGVAATLLPDGAISPGGIGFDINCGVRLLASTLEPRQIAPFLEPLVHELSRAVPAGFGRAGRLSLSRDELDRLLEGGCPELIRRYRLGNEEDLAFIESGGALASASATAVSERAKVRGHDQIGTLGGGNHFLEIQVVDQVLDAAAAGALGIQLGCVTVSIHTGSRGLGHQVCSDYVQLMDEAAPRYGYELPDRQLAAVPFSSPDGQRYFGAMCAAANFAFCNRQVIGERARETFARILPAPLDRSLRLVYDVGHNTAKVETFDGQRLCVHRKGATRAFGPSAGELSECYRSVGQPVLIPGSMGTASFVLVGSDRSSEISLSSACHGAGRSLSRSAAKRQVVGHELRKELTARGIVVRCPSNAELAEEAPIAYKDVERVVGVVEGAGIARKVARLRPLGVVKG